MPKKGKVFIDLDKLKELTETLKNTPHIEVGVFEGKNARRSKGMTNATLAAIHEYGAPEHGLPARSILVTPLHDHKAEIMAPMKGQIIKLVKSGEALKLWKSIGLACEKIILQAFDTGGFGKWAPLQRSTLLAKLKGSLRRRQKNVDFIYRGQLGMGILIDTAQLRRAYSSRVKWKVT